MDRERLDGRLSFLCRQWGPWLDPDKSTEILPNPSPFFMGGGGKKSQILAQISIPLLFGALLFLAGGLFQKSKKLVKDQWVGVGPPNSEKWHKGDPQMGPNG